MKSPEKSDEVQRFEYPEASQSDPREALIDELIEALASLKIWANLKENNPSWGRLAKKVNSALARATAHQ